MIGRAYQIPDRCAAILQHLRSESSLVQSVHRCVGDLRFRLLNNRAPLINEDGLQKRDFVSVYDVARACRLALETKEADGQASSISASGNQYTSTANSARRIARVLGKDIAPEITGQVQGRRYTSLLRGHHQAREVLGFEPCISLEDGFADLAAWLEGQIASDRVAESRNELAAPRLDGMSEPCSYLRRRGLHRHESGIQVARRGHSRAGV